MGIIFAAGSSTHVIVIFRHLSNFCFQLDPVLQLVVLEWVALSNPVHFRANALQLLVLLEAQEVRHLLLDMNSFPDLSVADQLWLGEHWMPGLVKLPLEHLILIIDGSRVHNQLAIDALHDLVQPAICFSSHYFTDVASALDWLTDGSPQLPLLAAEWAARYAPGA